MPGFKKFGMGLLLGCLLALAGCSGGSPSLEGTVTLDDTPVEEGTISFVPEEGTKGPKLAAPIVSGKFAIAGDRGAVPGKYRVEISWMKKTGRKIPSADPGIMTEEAREAVPPRYNAKSTLTEEITTGNNVKNFGLKSN